MLSKENYKITIKSSTYNSIDLNFFRCEIVNAWNLTERYTSKITKSIAEIFRIIFIIFKFHVNMISIKYWKKKSSSFTVWENFIKQVTSFKCISWIFLIYKDIHLHWKRMFWKWKLLSSSAKHCPFYLIFLCKTGKLCVIYLYFICAVEII